MITGLGIDIVKVPRIERAYAHYGRKLARRILHAAELAEFDATRQPVRFLALRFAAKEAVSKALGTGFRRGVAPRLIQVVHDAAGKPGLRFHGAVAGLIAEQGVGSTHVSLTDEVEYAAAVVVFEAA